MIFPESSERPDAD